MALFGSKTAAPGAPPAQGAPNAAQLPGSAFDWPGVPGGSTQWYTAYDSTTDLSATFSASTQTQVQGIQQFKQTDVVCDWLMQLTVSQTYTAGTTQTLTASSYAPYNLVGPTSLLIQNQYASVTVESGIDLYLFEMIFPQRKGNRRLNDYANPAGSQIGGTAGIGYLADAIAQPNLVNSAQWATSVSAYKLLLRLPAALWFDRYFDLAVTGEVVAPPHPALVSPQYMAGTTRNITPAVKINPGFGSTTDLSPVFTTTTTGGTHTASTYSGSATVRFRRHAIYAGNLTTQPPVYAWQYRTKTERFGIGGLSKAQLLVPLDAGQILALYVRLFDPKAATTKGAPITLATVTTVALKYGSGLNWFQGTPAQNQAVWLEQHGWLPPKGVFGWDLARDERDQVTNARALNTLTTAGVLVTIKFTATQSSAAYAVMGIASLVYVT